jgi:hypothetical protein
MNKVGCRNIFDIVALPVFDGCRVLFARVCFAVLRSYFDHTALAGRVCDTNVFVNVFSASSCHLEATV